MSMLGSDKAPLTYRSIEANLDSRLRVTMLLGVLEDLSIAMRLGYADERTTYQSLGSLVPTVFYGLAGYIDGLRSRNRDKTIYVEIERFAEAWREGKSAITSAPFEMPTT